MKQEGLYWIESLKEWSSLLFLLLVVVLLTVVVFYNQTAVSSHSIGISVSKFQFIGLQSINSSGSTLVVQFVIMNATPLGVILRNASYFSGTEMAVTLGEGSLSNQPRFQLEDLLRHSPIS